MQIKLEEELGSALGQFMQVLPSLSTVSERPLISHLVLLVLFKVVMTQK